jgi:hypothetical protein
MTDLSLISGSYSQRDPRAQAQIARPRSTSPRIAEILRPRVLSTV